MIVLSILIIKIIKIFQIIFITNPIVYKSRKQSSMGTANWSKDYNLLAVIHETRYVYLYSLHTTLFLYKGMDFYVQWKDSSKIRLVPSSECLYFRNHLWAQNFKWGIVSQFPVLWWLKWRDFLLLDRPYAFLGHLQVTALFPTALL